MKPAHEPIVVARKPLSGTVAGNVLEHGTGALNIDGCRIATDEPLASHHGTGGGAGHTTGKWNEVYQRGDAGERNTHTAGRWPANVVLDPEAAAALDKQSGITTAGAAGKWSRMRRVVGLRMWCWTRKPPRPSTGKAARYQADRLS